MPQTSADYLGILPSLEVLPFFADEFQCRLAGKDFPFHLKTFSSYGEISRSLLTRKLMGGIIPWEIFIADILALPGQRACWKIPIFLQACPTELVLREPIYKAFYSPQGAAPAKLPQKLSIGIESQHSLTKVQLREWLANWKGTHSTTLSFTMLPMETRMEALQNGSVDAIIARSPWGIHAESSGLGRRDSRFNSSKYNQRLVLVCHREFLEANPHLSQKLSHGIALARTQLKSSTAFSKAIACMTDLGKPFIRARMLEKAADLHSFSSLDDDIIPDIKQLVSELMLLGDLSILPSQVAASEQTARLLLPS
jgi:hypothetical protein